MIGEIVQWENHGKQIKGLVFCYMPNGGPEMREPYLKAYLMRRGVVVHNNIHLVKLGDPTLATLTLDREDGARMEKEYAGKTEDPKCCH